MTNLEAFYIVSAVRGAIGPGDVVSRRTPGAVVVSFGVALVVVGAIFAFAPDDPAAASVPVGVGGDKLGGANTG